MRSVLTERFADANVCFEENVDGFLASLSLSDYDLVIVSDEIADGAWFSRPAKKMSYACSECPTIVFFESNLRSDRVHEFAAKGYKGALNKNVGISVIIEAIDKILFNRAAFVYGVSDELIVLGRNEVF